MVQAVEEADVHVQKASIVEPGKTDRDPIFSTSGFDTPSLKQHVEDEMQVAWMQRVLLRTNYTDQTTCGDDQTIEEIRCSDFEQSIIDDSAMGFAEAETFQGRQECRGRAAGEAIC
jgi:hypothetical protein